MSLLAQAQIRYDDRTRPAVSVVGALLSHHQRALPGGLAFRTVIAAGAGAIGLWLGMDLRGGSPLAISSSLYLLTLAAIAPLPLAALDCLYHAPLHQAVLPWPVSPAQHFALGTRLFAGTQWPWLVLMITAAWSATSALSPASIVASIGFAAGSVFGAALIALGAAGICAALSDADMPPLRQLRAGLAGPFASQRHAPFLYLPAVAFGIAMATVSAARDAGLAYWLAEPSSSEAHATAAWAIAKLLLPIGAGVPVLATGVWAYSRHALRAIPRVHEEAHMIYGGHPAPADPPYGLALSRWLPASSAPHYRKELREQGRAQRGLWAWIALALLAALLYGVNAGRPTRAAPVLSLLFVVWIATLPTRATPQLTGERLLLTLPLSGSAAWLGRWLALLFVGMHLTAGVALALLARHGTDDALLMGLVLVATSLLATATTQPRRSDRLRAITPLVPAIALGLGLVGLHWFVAGICGLVMLAAAAIVVGTRH